MCSAQSSRSPSCGSSWRPPRRSGVNRVRRPAGAAAAGSLGLLFAVVLVALNLRPAVASLPPLVDAIAADLTLSATAIGLLTTLPVACMGLFAPVAALASARVGLRRVLAGALVLIAAGTAIRSVLGTTGLYLGSVLAGAGVAVAGALLPGLVKAAYPHRIPPVTGVYTAGLIGGALVGAAGTEPLRAALGISWPAVLALWSIPAVVALACWWPASARSPLGSSVPARPAPARRSIGPDATATPRTRPWRVAGAWPVTVFMGLQSLLFYATLAWLAARYTGLGLSTTEAGLLLGVFSATQIVSALGLPALAHRGGDPRPWIAGSVGLTVAGLLLVALAPAAAPWVWASVLGLGMGGNFAMALTLLAQIPATPAAAASVSGLAFFVGYLLAAAGPVAAGAARDLTGGYEAAFLILAGLGVLTLMSGVAAGAVARGEPRAAQTGRATG